MIGALAPYLSKIRRSYQSNDLIDRLNYQYTAVILALAGFTLTATQYVGKPIQCWVPPEFTGAWEKYAETYCFIKGTYFLPTHEEIDADPSQRDKVFVGYYQWASFKDSLLDIPLILGLQAFLFYLPSFIWKALNFNTGINVKSVLNNAAQVKKKFDKGTRSNQVQKAAAHITEALEMQRELKTSKNIFSIWAKRNGNYLSALYLFTKLLYVLNVLLQFVILDAFLGPEYTLWGWGVLNDIWNGRQWTESGHFPRVTLCDFNVRVLGNIHRWTVQCVLMINMFNEKIFVFFWFWFIFCGVLSLLSLFYWFFAIVLYGQRKAYVAKYLRCTSAISEYPSHHERELLSGFVGRFLRSDGVFLIRLIQTNGGDLLTGEILNALFARYKARIEEQSRSQALTESPNSGKI
ncbi:Innexin [Aphelenchoides bicaudatus]|nr:Innexin [Aphelenchoides bicaudatus]